MDEAEGEIWQSKKICFTSLAAPFGSCPIPSLKITRFSAANFLQTQALTWKFNSAVGENRWAPGEKEKPVRKDERSKDLEVICHSGLNNFCNMIVPLPKIPNTSSSARSGSPPSPSHALLTQQNFTNPSPCSQFFFLRLRGCPISARKKHVGS